VRRPWRGPRRGGFGSGGEEEGGEEHEEEGQYLATGLPLSARGKRRKICPREEKNRKKKKNEKTKTGRGWGGHEEEGQHLAPGLPLAAEREEEGEQEERRGVTVERRFERGEEG